MEHPIYRVTSVELLGGYRLRRCCMTGPSTSRRCRNSPSDGRWRVCRHRRTPPLAAHSEPREAMPSKRDRRERGAAHLQPGAISGWLPTRLAELPASRGE